MDWDKLADETALKNTVDALKQSNIEALVVENGEAAKEKVLQMIPEGAEVMNMTSVTIDTIGLADAINKSGKYDALHPKLLSMNRDTEAREMARLRSAPEWAVGSAHAVTQDGKVLVASNTGSQLPAYAYGAAHVVLVMGTQKVVKNIEDARKRAYDYVLPLESIRGRKAYGQPDTWHSNVSKELIINKEVMPGRITIILVKEKVGF
jgi:hypothetical protein